MHIPGYRQEKSGSAYEPRNCNIGAEQPLCNQPCSCPAQPRLPHPKQALGIQSSKCRIHNLPCVQMKKNCCQGNTQISKLKYSSALNEPERSCGKFTQVQQRFLAECGEEIIKRSQLRGGGGRRSTTQFCDATVFKNPLSQFFLLLGQLQTPENAIKT